ncbi:hypothetical protein [Granulicella arctica]|uniref:hypothetical protein n=1 Tax=Granulicella arctica TaxID=940613 RepID=UPI0021DF88DA|nr:hypothetical protein [Granulicella arctica]
MPEMISIAALMRSQPTPRLFERRRGVSDMELAARKLYSATQYLVLEQLEGRRGSPKANRQAIAILCEAGRRLVKTERRHPARGFLHKWLEDEAHFELEGIFQQKG